MSIRHSPSDCGTYRATISLGHAHRQPSRPGCVCRRVSMSTVCDARDCTLAFSCAPESDRRHALRVRDPRSDEETVPRMVIVRGYSEDFRVS